MMAALPVPEGAIGLALAAGMVLAAMPLLLPVLYGRWQLLRLALAGSLCLAAAADLLAGLAALGGQAEALLLPAGLPWLPLHLKLDALGGFFLLVIGALLLPVGLYSCGYLRDIQRRLAPLAVFLPLFVLGMQGVVLADDAFAFMLFWELMSVSSYFLVTLEHQHGENRKAGFIYLLMAHLAGLLILGGFAVLYAAAGSFEFAAMREAALSPFWASVAFLLAGLGFGMKAGVVPLHVWLPEAHPVAPSNVSALMSGVMLKVAIFGLIRVVWDLVGTGGFQWWWGALVLAAGSGSAVAGVLLALQQHDLKRLLAYHSVENIGIILIGLGLGMLFAHFGHPLLAALGLVAALYHTLNHALFKGLLFMGAGAVLHATGTRDMEKMGGLIRNMPVTSVVFLVACVSISALPPFNGFVSEWLTFQAALLSPQLGGTILTVLVPFSVSTLALAGALAAACFVKVFGVVFLGQARSEETAKAREVDRWMQVGMVIPALLCLLLGILPTLIIPLMDAVPQLLIHASLADSVHAGGWLWLTPVSGERASYAPLIVLVGMLLLAALAFWLLHPKGVSTHRGPAWGCGQSKLSARMQYTATSFSQPLRRIYAALYRPVEHFTRQRPVHTLLTRRVKYEVHVTDLAWQHVYAPIGRLALMIAERVAKTHHRSIHALLAYSFVTILVLLALIA